MKGKPLWALGCMSGTSLDGVDAAMILTDGRRVLEQGPSAYRPYTSAERETLRAVLGRWPGPGLEEAAKVLHQAHAEVISGFEGVELVGFHGQTLAHAPHTKGTHQLGDGAHLANEMELPVVWDFRSADVHLGGQGAPLASFYHHAIARSAGLKTPVGFLNLGGVGNLTWVDPRQADPAAQGALLAFDTGPANAPVNDLVKARRGLEYDAGGALAAQGQVDADVVEAFLARAWFSKIPPKSLDRHDFHDLLDAVAALPDADAAATLVACAAAAVAAGLEQTPTRPEQLYLCGGGRKNPVLKQDIAGQSLCAVSNVDELGFDGDMLEAQAFAFLAVRVVNGLPTSAPGTTGVSAAVGGGTISHPVGERSVV